MVPNDRGLVYLLDSKNAILISIDAISALAIVVLIFSTFYMVISATESQVSALKYAYLMASDTTHVLETVTCGEAKNLNSLSILNCIDANTLLTEIVRKGAVSSDDIFLNTVDNLVPEQYGYSLEIYSPTTSTWQLYFNSSDVASSRHNHVRQYKLRASAERVATVSKSLQPAPNPYCYISCKGDGSGGPCAFPCNEPASTMVSPIDSGMLSVILVRMTVYL